MKLLRRLLCALGLHQYHAYERTAVYMGHHLFPARCLLRCRWCGRVR